MSRNDDLKTQVQDAAQRSEISEWLIDQHLENLGAEKTDLHRLLVYRLLQFAQLRVITSHPGYIKAWTSDGQVLLKVQP